MNQFMNHISAREAFLAPEEYAIASERGRALAAEAIRCNPDSRRRMEQRYGIEFCMKRYPEAYGGRNEK